MTLACAVVQVFPKFVDSAAPDRGHLFLFYIPQSVVETVRWNDIDEQFKSALVVALAATGAKLDLVLSIQHKILR